MSTRVPARIPERMRGWRGAALAVLVPVELWLAIRAWRDLGQRGSGGIRGGKRLWRILVLLNPGNSIFYWLFGRRRYR
jgi:hypothetical protein